MLIDNMKKTFTHHKQQNVFCEYFGTKLPHLECQLYQKIKFIENQFKIYICILMRN